jgi:hypothetical protein
MAREFHPTDTETYDEPRLDAYIERRSRLLAKTGLFLGTLASAIAAGPASALPKQESSSKPITNVGFFEQNIMSFDFTQDLIAAELIKEAGGTDVEVRINYTEPQSNDVGEQFNLFCTAAQAAQQKDLTMSVNFQTYQRGGIIGWVPTSPVELNHFNSFLLAFEDGLAGDNKKGQSAHRCPNLKNPFKKFRFSIGGEPNYEVLFKPQYDESGNFVAPANAVHLMASTAPALQKEAKRLKASVEVSMGSFTPGHSPINFINAMGEVIKNEKIKWPSKVAIGVNQYVLKDGPFTVHPSGDTVGPADLQAFIDAAAAAFGYKPNIVVDEMGDQPSVPWDKVGLYQSILPNVEWVDEAGQAAQYREVLNLDACAGVEEVNMFHEVDDYEANPWSRAGVIYPPKNPDDQSSYEPKASYIPVVAAIGDALNGNFQC